MIAMRVGALVGSGSEHDAPFILLATDPAGRRSFMPTRRSGRLAATPGQARLVALRRHSQALGQHRAQRGKDLRVVPRRA
jgi:hypothetical protein